MSSNGAESPSSLLEYLPAIYQDDPFLGQFLSAFEKILVGREDGVSFSHRSMEAAIADVATLFDPQQTPADFLPWLASWTAFSMRADLSLAKKRDFISRIIQLYNWRGTKKNLQALLSIFTIGTPTIIESIADECQVGVSSTVGQDMSLGGGPAHFFRVTISLKRETPGVIGRQMEIARALIELEKPAHTHYELVPRFPSMQIGVQSQVGVDTLLGTIPEPQ